MAENKKSVLLYCDIIHTVNPLTDEEAGRLFKHYLKYVNDMNPEPVDRLTGLLFEPIKQNLKRDLRKWEERSLRNSKIAKEGWEKRNNANASESIQKNAKNADKVTVTDKVTVKEIISKEITDQLKFPYQSEEFLKLWDDLSKTKKWRKKPISALQASLNKLKGNSEPDAIKMLQNALAGEWQGLHDLKPHEKSNQGKIPNKIDTILEANLFVKNQYQDEQPGSN